MSKTLTKRQRNVRVYLETNKHIRVLDLRRWYALYLSGMRIDGDYDKCPHNCKSAGANADIELILDVLCINWEEIRVTKP